MTDDDEQFNPDREIETPVPGFRFEEPARSEPKRLPSLVNRFQGLGCGRVLRTMIKFGPFSTTLVPVARGTKKPCVSAWQQFELDTMADDGYVKRLEGGNIAILTGPASGGLVSIDFDDDAAYEEFRRLNPDLCANTITSRGARGCNLWLKLESEYPLGPQRLSDQSGASLGELRAGSCITVVEGTHPSGVTYTTSGTTLAVGEFSAIQWPERWVLPWRQNTIEPYDRLVERYGVPFLQGPNSIRINEPFFVGKFKAEHVILRDPSLGFYRYNDDDGVWHPVTEDVLKTEFSQSLKDAADEAGHTELIARRNDNLLRSFVGQLRGAVEARDAFRQRGGNVIHTREEMIQIIDGGRKSLPFDPAFRSLSKIPIRYNPDATCPRFVNELLAGALDPDDIALLQKLFGSFLLGTNPAHKLVIFEGPGGTGKSQICRLVDLVLGERNVAELRTEHIDGRFETASYVGKLLLAGRDVPGDFLERKGARFLKKLTGGDLITVERKGVNERGEIRGDFNVLITTNARLSIALDGDVEAWKRRIVLFAFRRRGERKTIPNFAEVLFREESEGILNWFIEGAERYLEEMKRSGDVFMTATQSRRRDDLLYESDSVAVFVRDCLMRATGEAVLSRFLFSHYENFCSEKGLDLVSKWAFEKRVGAHISEIHQGMKSENVNYNGLRSRGYAGVAFAKNSGCNTDNTDNTD